MVFVEVIAKNLLRRKLRTLLTIAGLAAAVATSTTLLSSAWSFAASSASYYTSKGIDIVVVRAGVAERITSSLSLGCRTTPRAARSRRSGRKPHRNGLAG
jgi:putative ABC transport system permease protein